MLRESAITAPSAREAGVVGDERCPADDRREHEVEARPERVGAAAMPERDGMPTVQRPPGEVDERRDHDPDRELPDEFADEPDRAEQRERGRDAAEDDLPERHA